MAEGFFVNLTGNLLREGYSVRCRTYGMSMYPTIEDGDKVVIEPVAPSQVERGDIILYRRHGGMIAHRVVRITRTERRGCSPQHCFILRGDASDSCDEPVESERILGKVVAVEQCGRSIALDGMGAKISHILRSYGSRFKRWIVPFVTSLLVLACLALQSAPALAQTVFVQDTFIDTNGTLLSAHNPDTGDASSWVKISSGTDGLNIQGNQLRN